MEGSSSGVNEEHHFGDDLQYIQRVLSSQTGRPCLTADHPHQRARSRARLGRKKRLTLRGSRQEPRCHAPAERDLAQERKRRQPDSGSKHNEPSCKSSRTSWHCEACDCWVARGQGRGGEDSWGVHIGGIRHTRSVLSLRETGVRGSTVVSIFEPLPAAKGYGLRGPPVEEEEVERSEDFYRLRTSAIKQLLHHTGSGSRYHSLVERFSEERLDHACTVLEQHRFPRRFFRQRTVNRWHARSMEFGVDAAMLAAMAHALECGKLRVDSLSLDVLTTHENDFPADLAGIVLLVRALPRSSVRQLTLCFSNWAGSWALCMLQPIGIALAEELGKRRLPLRRVCFSFPTMSGSLLRTVGAEICQQDIVAAAAENALETRQAVMMATHTRSRARQARHKCIADLPPDVLLLILNKAAPLAPLEIEIEARAHD